MILKSTASLADREIQRTNKRQLSRLVYTSNNHWVIVSKQLKHKQQLRIIVQYGPFDHDELQCRNYSKKKNHHENIKLKSKHKIRSYCQRTCWSWRVQNQRILLWIYESRLGQGNSELSNHQRQTKKKEQLVNRKLPLKAAEGSYKTLLPQGPQNHQLNYFLKLHLLNKVYLNMFILLPT